MFKINRKVEYAMIALKHMRQKAPGQLTSAKEICDAYHIPFDPTSRVLQVMAQHGILRAEQGVYGGYQLLKDLSKLSLGDLNDMLVGPIRITTCVHGTICASRKRQSCDMIGPMQELNTKLSDLFHTIKLLDFLEIRT